MRHHEGSAAAEALPAGDAWARMSDAACEDEWPVAGDHGAAEEEALRAHEDKLGVLRHASTGQIRSALLTTAVHIVRSGGRRLSGVSAAATRGAGRLDVLAMAVDVHKRSEDDSQMLGLAIEFALV